MKAQTLAKRKEVPHEDKPLVRLTPPYPSQEQVPSQEIKSQIRLVRILSPISFYDFQINLGRTIYIVVFPLCAGQPPSLGFFKSFFLRC